MADTIPFDPATLAWDKQDGLLPAIVQDADTLRVLMLGYMDHDALAATLASGGICPLTGERVFSQNTVKRCLSLMYSCGMYDLSGKFAFQVSRTILFHFEGFCFVLRIF